MSDYYQSEDLKKFGGIGRFHAGHLPSLGPIQEMICVSPARFARG